MIIFFFRIRSNFRGVTVRYLVVVEGDSAYEDFNDLA